MGGRFWLETCFGGPKGGYYMGNVKSKLRAKALDSSANTSAEETAKAEHNATDKTKRDVLEMSATMPCPKRENEINDDKPSRSLSIQTAKPSSEGPGDLELEKERAPRDKKGEQ